MSYVFTQAPIFVSASTITALEHHQFAEAFNSRILSGLGNWTTRIHSMNLGLTRQCRNPDSTGFRWAPVDEFQKFYAHLNHQNSDGAIAPARERGEPEGPNLANQFNAFVFGNPSVDGEGDRLNYYQPYMDVGNGTTLEIWNTAKYQRGGYDPVTGNQNAPMFSAAQSHMQIVQPHWSFHGKNAPSYVPQWATDGTYCYNEDFKVYYPKQIIKFRNLDDDSLITFDGTCGPTAGGSNDDVSYIADLPFAYYVYKYAWSGEGYTSAPTVSNLTRFAKSDWIAVKDGGGVIGRNSNDAIGRLMLNAYLRDFRGTVNQRSSSCFDIKQIAFNFEEFFSNQYLLAPSYAVTIGDQLDIQYPSWRWDISQPSGTINTSVYHIHEDFVAANRLVKAVNLIATCTINTLINGEVVDTFTVNSGSSETIYTYPMAYEDCDITFQLGDDLRLGQDGYLFIEVSELMQYKPEIWDAYCLIRMSSTNGHSGDIEQDTSGHTFESAKALYDNYATYGAVVNYFGALGVDQQTLTWTLNPTHDSMRRFVQQFTRVLPRQQIQMYEVSASKSVLYFERYVYHLDGDLNMDGFRDILSTTDSGSNCIATLAPTASWTNEWVLDLGFNNYGVPETSEWKTSAYSDYFPSLNRAHFMNLRIGNNNRDMFVAFQQTPFDGAIDTLYRELLIAPESPDAYSYAQDSNRPVSYWTDAQKTNWYKSNQIYKEPYVIEEMKMVNVYGSEYVKVVLDRRLQHCDEAPETVNKEIDSWDVTALHNQSYRTDENALMEYLVYNATLTDHASHKIGDCSAAFDQHYESWTGNLKGCVIPSFYLTKLLPKPYLSDNTGSADKTIINADLPMQAEYYLAAGCEGFVDGTTPLYCDSIYDMVYDYTFENLCYDAFGGRWINQFPVTIRPDEPQSYGPLPYVRPYASCLNQLSMCVNKLTKVRMCVPWLLETNTKQYYSDIEFRSPSYGDPCGQSSGLKAIIFGNSPPTANNLVNESGWVSSPDSGIAGGCSFGWTGDCNGTDFGFLTLREAVHFRFQLADPLSVYCMSSDLYDLFISENNAFFGRKTSTAGYSRVRSINDGEVGSICGDADYPFIEESIGETTDHGCLLFTNGIVDTGSPPSTDSVLCGRSTTTAGSSNGISIEIRNTNTMVVEVPTV